MGSEGNSKVGLTAILGYLTYSISSEALRFLDMKCEVLKCAARFQNAALNTRRVGVLQTPPLVKPSARQTTRPPPNETYLYVCRELAHIMGQRRSTIPRRKSREPTIAYSIYNYSPECPCYWCRRKVVPVVRRRSARLRGLAPQ